MLLKIFWVGYFGKNIKTKKGTTMTTNHLILDFRMYIAMKTYQKISAFTGWTALKLKSVICIVPDRQKRKSEKKSSHMEFMESIFWIPEIIIM